MARVFAALRCRARSSWRSSRRARIRQPYLDQAVTGLRLVGGAVEPLGAGDVHINITTCFDAAFIIRARVRGARKRRTRRCIRHGPTIETFVLARACLGTQKEAPHGQPG